MTSPPRASGAPAPRLLQLREWENESLFATLLSPSFDESSYITSALASSPAEVLAELQAGVRELTHALRHQVVHHHSDLLAQTQHIEAIEGKLSAVRARIGSLQVDCERVSRAMLQPYDALAHGVAQLAGIQAVCDLLRRALRVLQLTQRLETQVSSCRQVGWKGAVASRELAKAANNLSELESILHDDECDLEGVEVVDTRRPTIEALAKLVRKNSRAMLQRGMRQLNPTEMSGALLVSFNLGELAETIQAALAKTVARTETELDAMLDLPASPSRAGMWGKVDTLCDKIFALSQQVWNLQRVLTKRHDSSTHRAFIEIVMEALPDSPGSLLQLFWARACAAIGAKLQAGAADSTFVRNVFTNEVPKLYRVFGELFSRVQRSTPGSTLDAANREQLLESLSVFKLGYVKRTLAKLNEPVQRMFPQHTTSPPTVSDVSHFVETVKSVLQSVVGSDDGLQFDVARSVAKAVRFFAVRAENLYQTQASGLAAALNSSSSGPSELQRHNASVYAAVTHLDKSPTLRRLMVTLAPRAHEILSAAWQELRTLSNDIFRIAVDQLSQEVEVTLLGMHEGPHAWTAAQKRDSSSHSQVIARIDKHVRLFVEHVVSLYQTPRTSLDHRKELARQLRQLCERVATQFVVYASLVHPIPEALKVGVVTDMSGLEHILHKLAPNKPEESETELPHVVRLHQLKDVLYLETSEAADYAATLDTTGRFVVVHRLLSRHSADTDGTSASHMPHALLNWTVDKYCRRLRSPDAALDVLRAVVKTARSQLELPEDPTLQDKHLGNHYPALHAAFRILSM